MAKPSIYPSIQIGKQYGYLTVLSEGPLATCGHRRWHCRCKCGREIDVFQSILKKAKEPSCGCLYWNTVRAGMRFGRLVTITEAGRTKQRKTIWQCLCDCGTYADVVAGSLNSGLTQSCGCWQKEITQSHATHGATRNGKTTIEYRIWAGIKSRTANPHVAEFKYYGGRGILMNNRWFFSFEDFLADILKTIGPWPGIGYSMDRIDNNGNYEPGNVRWATYKEQANNRRPPRNEHYLTYAGLTLNLSQWARKVGLSLSCLSYRLTSGWTIKEALILPKHPARARGVTGRA